MPATMIPSMRYADAPAAIEWLQRAFGFEAQLVVPDGAGGIAHAQLLMRDPVRGDAMVMLGSNKPGTAFNDLTIQPRECGMRSTQCPYIVIDATDAHCERAAAVGAEMVMPIADQDYGGRVYSCRDPEGHLWCFGSYDPWAEASS